MLVDTSVLAVVLDVQTGEWLNSLWPTFSRNDKCRSFAKTAQLLNYMILSLHQRLIVLITHNILEYMYIDQLILSYQSIWIVANE